MMQVWSEERTSPIGEVYYVRLLLTEAEARHLQAVGVVGSLWRVVDMQAVADIKMAEFERGAHLATGGTVQ